MRYISTISFIAIAIFFLTSSSSINGQSRIHRYEARSIAWSPTGEFVAIGGGTPNCTDIQDLTDDPSIFDIRIFDGETGEQIAILSDQTCQVMSLAWNSDGTQLASGGLDGFTRVWDINTGERVTRLEPGAGRYAPVTGLAWNPTNNVITLFFERGGASGLFTWDAVTGEILQISENPINAEAVAWSPDSTQLAVGNFDPTVQIVNAETFQVDLMFEAFQQSVSVSSVDWNSDGTMLAVAGRGLRIFDPTTGELLRELREDDDYGTYFVKWSPDDTMLASTDAKDQTIRIWDAITGEQLHIIENHSNHWSLDWSPDSTRIVYYQQDIEFFEVSPPLESEDAVQNKPS